MNRHLARPYTSVCTSFKLIALKLFELCSGNWIWPLWPLWPWKSRSQPKTNRLPQGPMGKLLPDLKLIAVMTLLYLTSSETSIVHETLVFSDFLCRFHMILRVCLREHLIEFIFFHVQPLFPTIFCINLRLHNALLIFSKLMRNFQLLLVFIYEWAVRNPR